MDIDTATTSARPEKVHGSKFRYWADKLAVESEPGLTKAQLMVWHTYHLEKPLRVPN